MVPPHTVYVIYHYTPKDPCFTTIFGTRLPYDEKMAPQTGYPVTAAPLLLRLFMRVGAIHELPLRPLCQDELPSRPHHRRQPFRIGSLAVQPHHRLRSRLAKEEP